MPITALKGNFNIKIPEGTQTGKSLRMKGLGMPVYQKENVSGDLYVKIIVDIPTKLSPSEKELFLKLSSLRP